MSRSAAASAPPLPMGFKFDSELSLTDNARAAWEAKKSVQLVQFENNARRLARKSFPRIDSEAIAFRYDEGLYPEVPLFEIDDELIAFLQSRGEFALVEICSGCAKHWKFHPFIGMGDLGRELVSRDAREPFQCQLCEALDRGKS